MTIKWLKEAPPSSSPRPAHHPKCGWKDTGLCWGKVDFLPVCSGKGAGHRTRHRQRPHQYRREEIELHTSVPIFTPGMARRRTRQDLGGRNLTELGLQFLEIQVLQIPSRNYMKRKRQYCTVRAGHPVMVLGMAFKYASKDRMVFEISEHPWGEGKGRYNQTGLC